MRRIHFLLMNFRFVRRVVLGALLCAVIPSADRASADDSFRPFKMKTLDGTQRTLSDVLGRATLVVFFFPTCQYCNIAFPEIQKIYDGYKDRGLSMIWINIVPEENVLIKNWQATHGYTVPILLGGKSVQNDYKLNETPTHYLLDARGKILSKHAGYKAGDEKDLEREIQAALK
jgi:cytochrome oxidase Cu insertion factor (SCO1/SenC/PrrC family)